VQLSPEILEEIRAVAADTACVERVWLFGSRAREDAEPRSDIDLAVECPGGHDAEFARVALRMAELQTLLPVDVVRLEEAGEELVRRIRRDGVVLYERRSPIPSH
jgi:predicted nucleotidyltransferase